MTDSNTAVLIERAPAPDEHFAHYADAFLASFPSPNTRRAYRLDLESWATWTRVWNIDPLACRRPHVDTYMKALHDRGLAAATRARRLTTVRSFFRYLQDEELVDRNPAAAVRTPRIEHRQQAALTRNQAGVLVDTAEQLHGYRWPLVAILLICGLRISEVTGANVEDLGVDRWHRTLDVHGKGAKVITVPLPPVVATALDRHLVDRGHPETGPLLTSGRGNRLSRTTASEQLRRICLQAGVPVVGPHAIRRTAIQLLLQDGVPLREVQGFARHENPATTARYDDRLRSMDAHPSYGVLRALA